MAAASNEYTFNGHTFDVVVVGAGGAGSGPPLAQVALAWLNAQPGIPAPIAGAASVAQVEDLLPAMTLVLTDDQLERLTLAGA